MPTTSIDRAERADGIGGRGIAPLVGIVLLVGVTVALAATVVAIGANTWTVEPTHTTADFELAADGERGTITIEYVHGDAIAVDDLSVTVAVNGDSLSKQPPVPFVEADGFAGAPRGPFNAASDRTWTPGERAEITIAGTNEPQIESNDSITVTLAADDRRVASLETTAT
ncbi:type IV pilin N-terminal domain-containing protein [Natronococcus wangiae]|uniref:type IV pilin N-terminal domain-containing protein n=1 Tax=Natronococcus wangiae TaxID=3068275 RepID=UPI00273D2E7D|nr:type IV pilin N-terminal domain-containing protein [Natronococcus sp. AD5]